MLPASEEFELVLVGSSRKVPYVDDIIRTEPYMNAIVVRRGAVETYEKYDRWWYSEQVSFKRYFK